MESNQRGTQMSLQKLLDTINWLKSVPFSTGLRLKGIKETVKAVDESITILDWKGFKNKKDLRLWQEIKGELN